jgi:hypothetical protein
MRILCISIWLVLAACGTVDAPVPPDPSVLSPPSRELAPASGRVSGGAWTVDVQLGGPAMRPGTGGSGWAVRNGAPLIP